MDEELGLFLCGCFVGFLFTGLLMTLLYDATHGSIKDNVLDEICIQLFEENYTYEDNNFGRDRMFKCIKRDVIINGSLIIGVIE